jgi:hypothetical protein
MKQGKWLRVGAVAGLLICAALPQLLIYYKGYYYDSNASPMLKYPLNAVCFLGVALLGYWYLKQYPSAFLPRLWLWIYLLVGLFIASQYIYHFIYPGWGTQTYLNTMSVFETMVSPLPFIVAWLLLQMVRFWNKRGEAGKL